MRSLAVAVLLASAALVAADLVTTDTYKCDETKCLPPTCQCARNSIPAGLTPDQIPQFVLLSHDNALDSLPYNIMQGVLDKKKQANGCNVPVTWFAMFYHSDCVAGKKALERGDEIAMQTNRFNPTDPFTATDPAPKYDSRDPKTGEPSVEIEITMSRKHWNEYCNISYSDMVGFRAPNYYNNPAIRKALSDNGYLYDSTLIERWYPNNPTSPSADRMLWPYTMDAGIPQECGFMGPEVGKCRANEKYEGLWEVPLYQAQRGEEAMGVGNYGSVEDGMPPLDNVEAFFKDQLDGHLKNGRTPMQLSTHYGWLTDKEDKVDPTCTTAGCELYPNANAKALGKFLEYAVKKPEVRFVTYSDLVRWMQNPVPLDKFDEWIDCQTPGVKADLSAVKLTDEQKEGAYYLRKLEMEEEAAEAAAVAAAAAAAAAAAPAPAPMVAVVEEVIEAPKPQEAPKPLPVEAVVAGATAAAGKVAVTAAALLAALLLAM